jgi:hypothetical protein
VSGRNGAVHESLVTFARSAEGSTVCITDVISGLACNCTCFACRQPLVARKGEIRRWHFAHAAQATAACEWAEESALHMAMKEIIDQERRIFVPPLHAAAAALTSWGESVRREKTIPGKSVPLDSVHLEHSVNPIRPDVVAMAAGKRLFLEVVVTHPVNGAKLGHIRKIGSSAIAFDLRNHSRLVDRDELRRLLLEDSREKKWVFNVYREQIEKALMEEVLAAIAVLEAAGPPKVGSRKPIAIAPLMAEGPPKFGSGKPIRTVEPDPSLTDQWLKDRRAMDRSLIAKMNIKGNAICFSLKHGGEAFLHARQDGQVWLEVTEAALWIAESLGAMGGEAIPGTLVWTFPKSKMTDLVLYLNGSASFVRNVSDHGF